MKLPVQNNYSKTFFYYPILTLLSIPVPNNLKMLMWSPCIFHLLLLNPNIISILATLLFKSHQLLLISYRVNSKPHTFKAICILTPRCLFSVFSIRNSLLEPVCTPLTWCMPLWVHGFVFIFFPNGIYNLC